MGSPPGAIVEIGVFKGGSAQVLYDVAVEQAREIYLYDTFAGCPVARDFDNHQIGEFADCDVENLRQELPLAHVVQGVFPCSIVPMPPIAFVHADADQYDSTCAICDFLPPLMVPRGAILFDDYRGLNGCIKAVDEYFPNRHVLPDGRALVRL